MRTILTIAFLGLGLAACTDVSQPQLGADGRPLPKRYNISASNRGQITYRMQDSVNALRQAAGAPLVSLNQQLTSAAATHSRDMSIQNRPWHFGSDGSSPIDRVRRVGYPGKLTGEVISETYETETETLAAWMDQSDTRAVILDRDVTQMGFAWYQEPNGKIWWTMIMGSGGY